MDESHGIDVTVAEQLRDHPRAPVHLPLFLTHPEIEKLCQCLDSSHQKPSNDLKTISGFQEQWDVEGTMSGKAITKTFKNIKSRTLSILEKAFEQNKETFGKGVFSNVLGMRSTTTTKPQFPHSDMDHNQGFVVIIYLSRCKSAYFHDDMFHETGSQLEDLPNDPEDLNDDYSFTKMSWKRYYRQNFSAMMSLDSTAYRCFDVNAGDAILFRSDSIHYGPGADPWVERRMLFFTITRETSFGVEMKTYDSNDKLQPWIVAERLYGRGSDIWRGVMRHYISFHPHLQYHPTMELQYAYGDEEHVKTLHEKLEVGMIQSRICLNP
jgi:hypothetical protein